MNERHHDASELETIRQQANELMSVYVTPEYYAAHRHEGEFRDPHIEIIEHGDVSIACFGESSA
jgi:hypothetical protein